MQELAGPLPVLSTQRVSAGSAALGRFARALAQPFAVAGRAQRNLEQSDGNPEKRKATDERS